MAGETRLVACVTVACATVMGGGLSLTWVEGTLVWEITLVAFVTVACASDGSMT